MKMKLVAAATSVLLATVTAGLVWAGENTIQFPPDSFPLKASSLPGYAKAQAVCAICHSAEYMQYQPPTAPRPYWEAMVKRMKGVFNAPVDDADIPLIVDYLVKTYGNEQPK